MYRYKKKMFDEYQKRHVVIVMNCDERETYT